MHNPELGRARFSDDHTYLIDSHGRKRNHDDPEVVHIWAWNEIPYYKDMIKTLFDKRGWNYRFAGKISQETLQDSKKICSGRECMGCAAFAGNVYKDFIENRGKNELSLYHYFNVQGPCQNAAWPDMWNIFAERLRIQNAIFLTFPDITNNFFGQGNLFGMEFAGAVILSDIYHEAENVIKCLAKNKEEALSMFAVETGKVIDSMKSNLFAVDLALHRWAKQLSKIPLQGGKAEIPKVMIFGTGEVQMLHSPVTDYFTNHGIIPKVLDLSGAAYILQLEFYTRNAFRRGKILVKDQLKILPYMLSFFNPKTKYKKTARAMIARRAALVIDLMRKRYNGIARKSGLLLSDKCPSLINISLQGNKLASINTFAETSQAVGAYALHSDSGVYDGLMHLRSFNCQPAVNAQAIIRPMAAKRDIPYAAMDMEGPWLSASQIRILEALSVQARRYHAQRQ